MHRPNAETAIERQKLRWDLSGCLPVHDEMDKPVWIQQSSRRFSVNSCYQFLNSSGISYMGADLI